jgi:hypothetical protein
VGPGPLTESGWNAWLTLSISPAVPAAPQAWRQAGASSTSNPISGAHFGCGAGAPPEVPPGGITFGSPGFGAGFSIAGSTSFGWMTPFDRFSFSLKLWPGAVAVGAAGAGAGLGASANADPATRVIPAVNRQSREPMIVMLG